MGSAGRPSARGTGNPRPSRLHGGSERQRSAARTKCTLVLRVRLDTFSRLLISCVFRCFVQSTGADVLYAGILASFPSPFSPSSSLLLFPRPPLEALVWR